MKIPICLLLIISSFSSFAQTTIDVLELRTKPNYSEKDTLIIKEPTVILFQKVLFDKPHVFDEEVWYTLTMTILDTTLAKQKKTISLPADSNIITCAFRAVTNWTAYNKPAINTLSGQIHITNWSNGAIAVQEDILVNDKENNRTFKYSGAREFTKE